MDSSSETADTTGFRRRYGGAIELSKAGVPIAVVLFGWFLVAELWWVDEAGIVVAGLLAGSVVAVRQGRRFGPAVPFGDGTIPEHGRVLLGVLPWLVVLPLAAGLLEVTLAILPLVDGLGRILESVSAWTAAGVVLVYLVAVLSERRVLVR